MMNITVTIYNLVYNITIVNYYLLYNEGINLSLYQQGEYFSVVWRRLYTGDAPPK